jgi:hypothetical protein
MKVSQKLIVLMTLKGLPSALDTRPRTLESSKQELAMYLVKTVLQPLSISPREAKDHARNEKRSGAFIAEGMFLILLLIS